jgi:hypothetical protein
MVVCSGFECQVNDVYNAVIVATVLNNYIKLIFSYFSRIASIGNSTANPLFYI